MKITNTLLAGVLALSACSSFAQQSDLSISITNLTQSIYFTPLLVATHDKQTKLFEVGMSASAELQAMAEGGDISGLSAMAQGAGARVTENPASGILAPSMSTSVSMDSGNMDYLSITAMLLPTNDGFVGLSAWMIPEQPGTYTIMLNGYDAGTEANNELLVADGGIPGMLGMPGIPGGMGGTGGTGVTVTEANTRVHIHRGNLGDADINGGVSDVNSSIHRWLNPVAKVVVTVH